MGCELLRRMLPIMAVLLCHQAAPGSAQIAKRSVSLQGIDSGDCVAQPCRTIQYAINQTPQGSFANINVAPGVYDEALLVYEFRRISLFGLGLAADDSCDPGAVVIRAPGGIVISTQDHATGIYRCFTVTTAVAGGTGFHARQHVIVDTFDVQIGRPRDPALGYAIAGMTSASVNCGGRMFMKTPVTVLLAAHDLSHGELGCAVDISQPGLVGYLITSANNGVVNTSQATFTGPGAATDVVYPYILSSLSTLNTGGVVLPGTQPGQCYSGSVVNSGPPC